MSVTTAHGPVAPLNALAVHTSSNTTEYRSQRPPGKSGSRTTQPIEFCLWHKKKTEFCRQLEILKEILTICQHFVWFTVVPDHWFHQTTNSWFCKKYTCNNRRMGNPQRCARLSLKMGGISIHCFASLLRTKQNVNRSIPEHVVPHDKLHVRKFGPNHFQNSSDVWQEQFKWTLQRAILAATAKSQVENLKETVQRHFPLQMTKCEWHRIHSVLEFNSLHRHRCEATQSLDGAWQPEKPFLPTEAWRLHNKIFQSGSWHLEHTTKSTTAHYLDVPGWFGHRTIG